MAIGNPINLTSNVEGKNISVIATAGQTQFTVIGGYRINQISVFRNGVRLVDGRDFTALDGSIVTLLSAATVADVIEFQVFDDFRVSDALSVNNGGTVNGNVTVTGILSTTNLSIGSSISLDATTGIITAVQVIGGTITGTATTAINAQGLTGTPDITVNNIVAAAGTFSGVLTYEDVTNIDSLGIVTARTGVDITANGLVVNAGVSTFAADLSIADKIVHAGDTNTALRFPSADTFTVETAGTQRLEVNSTGDLGLVGIATATGLVVVAGSGVYAGHTGIITAVTFDGNVTGNISGGTVAGSTGTFTGEVNIADKIVHTGDTNTTIRFPSNDTFTVETTGVERLRVDSAGDVGLVGIATATGLVVVAGSGIYAGHTGIITAVTFDGNATGLTGTPNIDCGTGSFTGDVDIADKIIHTGDTNTAIRFPAADTFTVETGGSEAIRVDSSQRLLVGSTSARANFFNGTTDPHIQLEGVDTPASTVAAIRCSDNAGSPRFLMGKARGSSVGSNTIVQDDDDLGEISFQGSDGTQFVQAADIRVEVDGTPGADDMPGRIVFGTTADGAASPTERLRIDSSGSVGVGEDSPSSYDSGARQLVVAESTNNAGITIRSASNKTGSLYFADGTTGNEAYRGRIEYVHSADELRLGTAGTGSRVIINSDGSITINAVPGTNNNASQAVLFQTSAGVIDGGSGLTYNPAEDALSVNGLNLTSQMIRTAGSNQLTLTSANGNGQSDIRINQSSITLLGGSTTRLNVFATGVKLGPGALIENGLYDSGGGLTGDYNHDLATYGNVHFSSTNAAAAFTYNLRINGSVSLNSVMAAGDTLSFTLMHASNNTSYYLTQLKIDGTNVTPVWAGGSAPSAATGSGFDVYSFSIMKVGNNAYGIFGTFTNHA